MTVAIQAVNAAQGSVLVGAGSIPSIAVEEAFGYTASCPVCEKRVFDVSIVPDIPVRVRLKCPHCRKVVKIPFPKVLRGRRGQRQSRPEER